jgi:hypothetical protein
MKNSNKFASSKVGSSLKKKRRHDPEKAPPDDLKLGLVKECRTFLSQHQGLDMTEFSTEKLKSLSNSLSRATRDQMVKGVASAYACYQQILASGAAEGHLNKLAGLVKRERNKQTDDLIIVLECCLPYQTTGQKPTAQDKLNAQKLYSRDARAIRYLIGQDIGPIKMIEQAKLPGEGLNAWSRAYSEQRKSSDKKIAPKKASKNDNNDSPLAVKGKRKDLLEKLDYLRKSILEDYDNDLKLINTNA